MIIFLREQRRREIARPLGRDAFNLAILCGLTPDI